MNRKPFAALLSFVALTLSSHTVSAAAPPGPIWSWTPEQRIALRFDAAARTARIDHAMTERHARAASRMSADAARDDDRPTDVVRGSEHPELLLPFEIFSTFTRAAYAREDDATTAAFREDATRKALAAGLPADFLNTLERESQAYLQLQRQEIALRDAISEGRADQRKTFAQVRALEAAECPARAAALRRLRSLFGSRFDQFLYTAVAPGVFFTFFEPQSAAILLAQERGCE